MPFEWRMSAHQWCRANFRFPQFSTWIYFDKMSRRCRSGKAVPINLGSPHDVAYCFVRTNNNKKFEIHQFSRNFIFHFEIKKNINVRHTDLLLLLSKAEVNGKIINFKCHPKCVLVCPSPAMHTNDERKRHITAEWIPVDMHSRPHKSESIDDRVFVCVPMKFPGCRFQKHTNPFEENPHLDIFSLSNLFDVDSFRSTFSTLPSLIVDVQAMVVVVRCSMLSRNAHDSSSWMGLAVYLVRHPWAFDENYFQLVFNCNAINV